MTRSVNNIKDIGEFRAIVAAKWGHQFEMGSFLIIICPDHEANGNAENKVQCPRFLTSVFRRSLASQIPFLFCRIIKVSCKEVSYTMRSGLIIVYRKTLIVQQFCPCTMEDYVCNTLIFKFAALSPSSLLKNLYHQYFTRKAFSIRAHVWAVASCMQALSPLRNRGYW